MNLPFRAPRAIALVAVAAALAVAPSASATAYTFTFNTNQLLESLLVADNLQAQAQADAAVIRNDGTSTDPDDYKAYHLNGYFSIFMQPLNTQLADLDYSYLYLASPKANGPDKWMADTIDAPTTGNPPVPANNYLSVDSGEWAQFSIVDLQNQQTLVSDAFGGNGGTESIFLWAPTSDPNYLGNTPPFQMGDDGIHPFEIGCASYKDPPPGPDDFSGNCETKATITSIMSGSAVWSIMLEITDPNFHGGYLTFSGFASAIESNDPTTYGYGGKVTTAIPFTMVLYTAPEPGTFVMLGAGILGLGLHQLRRRRSSTR